MNIEIYYFSGTGNSLFVARELKKRIPSVKLTPIISTLSYDSIKIKGNIVGLIFPVHALTIPIAVKEFIKKVDFKSTEYIFTIATREGTIFRGFKEINRLLEKKKKKLNSQFIINMYSNDSRQIGYTKPTKSEISLMEKEVAKEMDKIYRSVSNKIDCIEDDTTYTINFNNNPVTDFLLEKLVLFGMAISTYVGGVNYFYTDSNCNGCGICEKVCLSQKIKIVEGKPVWQKKVVCYMCYACLNYCPLKAVQIKDIPGVKSYSRANDRYSHPFATIKDISSQKRHLNG